MKFLGDSIFFVKNTNQIIVRLILFTTYLEIRYETEELKDNWTDKRLSISIICDK